MFLKAADLLAGPYRDVLNAATMLGQSKTCHQAEIDSACELIDFFRFNVAFYEQVLREQPQSSPGMWNRLEHRPLEGFVFAVSPFNFTSIAGNLPTAPALCGNTVLWKPASTSVYSAHFLMQLFKEAGLPDGVINLVTGSGADIGNPVLASPHLAGIHFTGSTKVFHQMWRTVGDNIDTYKSYPRLVGETGGKDFIVAHPSADPVALTTAIVRGAFEYQGQKCSAASRVYVPSNLWPQVKDALAEQVASIRMGDVADFSNFMGAVIDGASFKTQKAAIDEAKAASDAEILVGGEYDDSEGWFVRPTVIVTKNPSYRTLCDELFGPVLTAARVRREQVAGNARPRRQHQPLRAHRRGLRAGPLRDRASHGTPAQRRRQFLHQRQAHRRRRRPATVRRRARIGHQRQGRFDPQPAALDQPAQHQGNVRPGAELRVSVHGPGQGSAVRPAATCPYPLHAGHDVGHLLPQAGERRHACLVIRCLT